MNRLEKEYGLQKVWQGSSHGYLLPFLIQSLTKGKVHNEVRENVVKLEEKDDKRFLLEQYKILVEGINKNTENRETLNNFWITLNGTIIAAITYVKDMQTNAPNSKGLFIGVLWGVGIIFSIVWLITLSNIKKNIDLKNEILIQVEKCLPAKIFTTILIVTGRRKGKNSLSAVERIIPILFCTGYIIMAIILYIYPNIVF